MLAIELAIEAKKMIWQAYRAWGQQPDHHGGKCAWRRASIWIAYIAVQAIDQQDVFEPGLNVFCVSQA